MKPINFPEKTHTFNGPEGSDVLPIEAFCDANQIITKWELSDEEIEKIKESKCLFVCVAGKALPPMFLTPETPFRRKEDAPPETPKSKIILPNEPGKIIKLIR